MSVEERVATPGVLEVVPKVLQGAAVAGVIPTRPAGNVEAPVFTHHS
jgi:hypothetical protein